MKSEETVSLSVVLKANSWLIDCGARAFYGPEIDLEHSLHFYGHSGSPECFFNISLGACDWLRWFRCSGEESRGC